MGLIFSVQIADARHEIKQRIKNGVPEEDRVLLKIPVSLEEEPNDIFQRKHSREFRYKGEMYDILKQERHGDTTWYTCIHDVKESGLFKDLDKKVNNYLSSNPEHRQQRGLAYAFFHQQYLASSAEVASVIAVVKDLRFCSLSELELSGYSASTWRPPIHSTLS